MTWKRTMLSSALLVTVACGDSENEGDGAADGSVIAPGDGGSDGGSDIDGGVNGRGDGGGNGNGGGGGDSGTDCNDRTLKITIRDFKKEHPDFEDYTGSAATKGLLQDTLVGSKPVFKASLGQITSASSFAPWYKDDPVNKTIVVERTLTPTTDGKSFEFWDPKFFPIDGQGWGNEDSKDRDMASRNFHFTTEIHTRFTYQRKQVFKFTGDDDLWIFVNNKLALDLGGLHSELTGEIDFDAQATQLGIVPGQTYQMDIFHAERHTVDSRFRITTNIECFMDVLVI